MPKPQKDNCRDHVQRILEAVWEKCQNLTFTAEICRKYEGPKKQTYGFENKRQYEKLYFTLPTPKVYKRIKKHGSKELEVKQKAYTLRYKKSKF